MADKTIQFPSPSGLDLTLSLFPLLSDTAVQSGVVCTEATNAKGFFTGTVDSLLSAAGVHRVCAFSGTTPVYVGYCNLTETTTTFPTAESPFAFDSSGRIFSDVKMFGGVAGTFNAGIPDVRLGSGITHGSTSAGTILNFGSVLVNTNVVVNAVTLLANLSVSTNNIAWPTAWTTAVAAAVWNALEATYSTANSFAMRIKNALTGHTPQTGDSYPIVSSGTHGNAALKTLIEDVPTTSEFNARTLDAADYFDPATDTVATVTNLTNLPSIPAAWITTAGIADGAFTAAKFASGAFDAVWSVANRTLTAFGFSTGLATAAKMLAYFQLLARKDAAIATDNATELGELNADEGSGAGAFANTTDALEAIRDRGDAAWVTATGFSTHSAADVWAEATRTLTSAANITSTGGTITVSSGKVTVGTNDDKTGYSLTQSFPANFADLAITASTGRVTVGTNADKTGYSLTQSFPTNFASLAITAAGKVTVGTNDDKSGYSISGTLTTLDAFNTSLSTAHGSGSWATATGFATPTDVTDARDAIITNGDLLWVTATGFATPTNVSDAANTVIAHGDLNWNTATGFSTHSAADVAALVLATPANLLVTDASGRVTVGSNADKSGYTINGTLTTLDALDTAQDAQHSTTQTALASVKAKTDLIPASPAAVGSAMTLADGAITDSKFTLPSITGLPTGILGIIHWLGARMGLARVTKDADEIKVYRADGTTVRSTNTYTSSGSNDDVGAAT